MDKNHRTVVLWAMFQKVMSFVPTTTPRAVKSNKCKMLLFANEKFLTQHAILQLYFFDVNLLMGHY